MFSRFHQISGLVVGFSFILSQASQAVPRMDVSGSSADSSFQGSTDGISEIDSSLWQVQDTRSYKIDSARFRIEFETIADCLNFEILDPEFRLQSLEDEFADRISVVVTASEVSAIDINICSFDVDGSTNTPSGEFDGDLEFSVAHSGGDVVDAQVYLGTVTGNTLDQDSSPGVTVGSNLDFGGRASASGGCSIGGQHSNSASTGLMAALALLLAMSIFSRFNPSRK